MDIDFDSLINQGAAAGEQYASSTPDLKRLGSTIATGASLGAAVGTVFPGIGTAIGTAVGTVVGAIYAAVPLVGGLFKGQCTITIRGLDSDCRDYADHVVTAAKWIKDNHEKALHLAPHDFELQAHILIPDFKDWLATISGDYRDKIRGNEAWPRLERLPGAQTLLRVVQVPAAAALAAAHPEHLSSLEATLPKTFPALLHDDVARVVAKVKQQLAARRLSVPPPPPSKQAPKHGGSVPKHEPTPPAPKHEATHTESAHVRPLGLVQLGPEHPDDLSHVEVPSPVLAAGAAPAQRSGSGAGVLIAVAAALGIGALVLASLSRRDDTPERRGALKRGETGSTREWMQ